MRQKQLTDETLFVLESKVEALRKSEEIAVSRPSFRGTWSCSHGEIQNQSASRMRAELAARDIEVRYPNLLLGEAADFIPDRLLATKGK
jgi:hypothetical protein